MNTRLTIEAPVEADDGQGAPLGASHGIEADSGGASVRCRIIMRCGYVLTLQHRLVDGPRVYRILSFRDRDGGRFIEIDAELRVA